MLEFSRLSAMLAGLVGGAGLSSALASPTAGLADVLQNAGIDPTALSGLTPDAVQQLLADHGIDPSTIMDGQIDQLFSALQIDAQGVDAISALWSNGSPNGHD